MLSIFETGDGSFRLVDEDDVDVGWVRDNHLGFGGFAGQAEAMAAALAGSEALAGFLERLTGAPVGERPAGGRVRVHADGEHEWVERGKVRLARLIRSGGDRCALEFALPSYVRSGGAITASQVVHQAIAEQRARPSRHAGNRDQAGATGFPAAS